MTIKSIARFLEYFCLFVIMPLVVIAFFYKWFQSTIPTYSDIADGVKQVNLFAGVVCSYMIPHFSFHSPLLSRILGIIVDGISVLLFCWGCICFIRLLRYYKQGELFSSRTLSLFRRLSRISFAWTLYNPFKLTLLSIGTAFFMPVGHHGIAFGVTSSDIINIFIVGFFLIIASLMQEAAKLQDELDLTV